MPLATAQASVEHLVGLSLGGNSSDANVVACCRSVNSLFGAMTVKDKLRVVLEQEGIFRCPAQPVVATTNPVAPDRTRLAAVIRDLGRRGTSRPRRLATLASTVNAACGNTLSAGEVQSMVEALRAQGMIHVNGEAVTYSLPVADG
jgi:hypothetical protein